jgi:hypothetical protein
MEATKEYNFIDPTKREDLPRWKHELVARIYLEENNKNYPDIVHVPYHVTPDAVLQDGYKPPEEIVHFRVRNSTRS